MNETNGDERHVANFVANESSWKEMIGNTVTEKVLAEFFKKLQNNKVEYNPVTEKFIVELNTRNEETYTTVELRKKSIEKYLTAKGFCDVCASIHSKRHFWYGDYYTITVSFKLPQQNTV